jgi:hypothetical protein
MARAFYRASLETRNFDFEAYGPTANAAKSSLIQALYRHGRQYKIDEAWFAQDLDDITVREIAMGAAYRDRDEI